MAYKPVEDSAPADPNDPILETKTADKKLAVIVYSAVALFLVGLITLGVLTWNVVLLDLGLKFNLGYWFYILAALYIGMSFAGNVMRTDQVGALYFFGTPIWLLKAAGLKFVPWGLVNMELDSADLQEIYSPGKKDDIFWGDDKELVPPGMVRAIRMTTRAPTDAETAAFDVQQSIGLAWFILWTITDPIQFRAHIRTIPEATSQLRTVSNRALSELIATYTASEAIANQATINLVLDDHIRALTKGWGVQINSTGLTDINYTHKLAAAMRDRAQAVIDGQTKVINATNTAKETELLGEADGKAARARAAGEILGRVDGMEDMMNRLKVDGASVLSEEAVRGVFKDADTVVVGAADGIRDVLGAVLAGKSALKQGNDKGGST